jgi:hypothetical protein
MAARDRTCDGPCRRLLPFDDLTPTAGAIDHYLCDECNDTSPAVLDYHNPDRWPPEDDGPTLPLGDPGEAGRSAA